MVEDIDEGAEGVWCLVRSQMMNARDRIVGLGVGSSGHTTKTTEGDRGPTRAKDRKRVHHRCNDEARRLFRRPKRNTFCSLPTQPYESGLLDQALRIAGD